MLALLRNAVRADLDRQLEWARTQAKRQAGHVALTVILTGIASLAGLGAVIIGLIAPDIWLAARTAQFAALGAIGGGLLLLALILLAVVSSRRRHIIHRLRSLKHGSVIRSDLIQTFQRAVR
jgi:hypothetical protein